MNISKICSLIVVGFHVYFPAVSSAEQMHPVPCIDNRLLKVIEIQLRAAKTEEDVRTLLGDPDLEHLMGREKLLTYIWNPTSILGFRVPDDETRVFLAGIGFKIDVKSGMVLSWSWNHEMIYGRDAAEKRIMERVRRDMEARRFSGDQGGEKTQKNEKSAMDETNSARPAKQKEQKDDRKPAIEK